MMKNFTPKWFLCGFASALVVVLAGAGLWMFIFVSTQGQGHAGHSQYKGQEARLIKSLSPDDIKQLRAGEGWGLAKAAELNGVPGPAHLLELKDEIPLNPAQITAIESLYDAMKTEAMQMGEQLVAQEQTLETHFRNASMDDADLRGLLLEIGQTLATLRYTHLRMHLKASELLSEEQINRYNTLRGY